MSAANLLNTNTNPHPSCMATNRSSKAIFVPQLPDVYLEALAAHPCPPRSRSRRSINSLVLYLLSATRSLPQILPSRQLHLLSLSLLRVWSAVNFAIMSFTAHHTQQKVPTQYHKPRHYTCYQLSKDGQSYRPIYYTQEALDAYLHEQQSQYDRRQEAAILQRQQESLRLQQDSYQSYNQAQEDLQRFYGSSYMPNETRTPTQYRFPASQEQYLVPRNCAKSDSLRLDYQPDTEHSFLSSYSHEAHFLPQHQQISSAHDYHMTYPHDEDTMHQLPLATGAETDYRMSRSHSSQCMPKSSTPSCHEEFMPATSESSHHWIPAEVQSHGHVDPNTLSLTPSIPHSTPSGADHSPGQGLRGMSRAEPCSNSRPTQSRNTGELDRSASSQQTSRESIAVIRPQSPTNEEEYHASNSEAEAVEGQPSPRPSSSADGQFEVDTGVATGELAQVDQEMSDTDAGAIHDDSDSDYSPEIQSRLRRRPSSALRYSSTQPKRGIMDSFSTDSSTNAARSSPY